MPSGGHGLGFDSLPPAAAGTAWTFSSDAVDERFLAHIRDDLSHAGRDAFRDRQPIVAVFVVGDADAQRAGQRSNHTAPIGKALRK